MNRPHEVRRAFGVVTTLLALGAPLSGQQASITVTSPAEWNLGQAFVTSPGASVRIAGTVIHPAGVRGVTVANRTADLKIDPMLPNIADFSIDLPLTDGMTRVTIQVTPSTGPFFAATYNVEFQARGSGSAQPPRPAATAPSASAAPRSAWQQMQPRHKWYYAGAALGLAMAFIHTQSTSEVCVPTVAGQNCYNRTTRTSYTVPGLGVVFATGTAAILDYRKTATRLRNEQGAGPGRPRLQAPAVGVQDGRLNLSLVRIRF